MFLYAFTVYQHFILHDHLIRVSAF